MNKLSIDTEAEWKFSYFQRNPEPVLTSSGGQFSHEYRFDVDGDVLRKGSLNSSFGVLFPDRYRSEDINFENQVRFDYGEWIRLETFKKHETDEDIFFSTSTEIQSPIHSVTSDYSADMAVGQHSRVRYLFKTIERNDVFLGTVVGEKTGSKAVSFDSDFGVLTFEGEYRSQEFRDQIGGRSDIDSKDIHFQAAYKPGNAFSLMGTFEESNDIDIDNQTELTSRETGLDAGLKLTKELGLRNRWKITEDNDTKTGEDIFNISNEIIVNFDPSKKVGVEVSYKYETEDKQKNAVENIDATVNAERFKLKLKPLQQLTLHTGYEVSDKESTSVIENTKITKIYSNVTIEPTGTVRLGVDVSNIKRKNTETAVTESDTSSTTVSLQYRPKRTVSLFLHADTTETQNPSTNSFTKTDMIGTNLDIDLSTRVDMSARTSFQNTTGSLEAAHSKRLLNSLGINVKFFKNLNMSTEYEIINSSGANASDENLFDTSFFYSLNRFDFSFRVQKRKVTGGVTPTDKLTMLNNIKYHFSRDGALSFRFSLVDYKDKLTVLNSYDSKTFETFLSLKF